MELHISVEPVLFGYMFCLFLTYPVEQQLIYHKLCSQSFNQTYCETLYNSRDKKYKSDQNLIQEQTAQWGIYMDIAKTLPAVLSTMFYGAWSDRIGRKTVMILPIVGDFIGAICNILNSYYFNASISYLLIGAITSSAFGNFAAMLLATFSYIADISSKDSRTVRVTILESMIYLGSVVSNISGGWLLQKAGFVPVFGLNCTIYFLLMIYWFFLPESYVPLLKETKSKLKDLFNKSRIQETFRIFIVKRNEKFRVTILLLIGCFCVLELCKSLDLVFIFYCL